MNHEYAIYTLMKERKVLTQDSDYISQEMKIYIETISRVESESINDLSDYAMDVAMNLKEYGDRLEYFESRLDFILDKIKEIDMAIKTLSGGEGDV